MRHLPTLTLACFALLLTACASGPNPGYGGPNPPGMVGPGPGPDPLTRTVTYTCEEGSKVVMFEGRPGVQVNFNSGLVMWLERTGLGRWSAGKVEFRGGGGEGVLYASNGRSFRCRVL